MSRSVLSLTTVVGLTALLAACGDPADAPDVLRPSLTMIRIGDVEPVDPPVVPDDHYLPGIQIKSEDYEYDETGRRRGWPPPPFAGEPEDLSRMRQQDDPLPLEKHVSYDYLAGSGRLFDGESEEDTLSFDDIEQGAIGDCYLVAALSAAAYADADGSVRDGLVRAQFDSDGYVTGYAVRFYDAWGDPQDVIVDADLVRKNGRPTYARSLDTDSDGEEWVVSLFEKAYAEWHGGYQDIGDGGWAGDVLQAVTGSTATYKPVARLSDSTVVRTIEDAVADNRPVVAGTFGEEDGVDYSGTKIYAWHAYTVLGVKRTEGEEPKITLRNPWGEVEPPGNGPDDGIFDLPLSDFRRLYQGLTFGGSARQDTTAPDAVDDLAAVAVVEGRVSLTFTATGDDRDEGLAATYDLRIAASPMDEASFYEAEQLAIGSPQAPVTAEQVGFALPEGQGPFYVAVRVEDEAGNLSPLSNVLKLEGDAPPVDGVEPTLFDFEGGAQGFETEGLFHRSNLSAVSGQYAFWMGKESTLDFNTGDRVQASLTSPILDLRGATSVYLMWESLLDVEPGTSRDKAQLQVATQSGDFEDWTTVWEKDAPTEDFVLQGMGLDAYAGTQVRLRFAFDSVDSNNNTGIGWLVDDVWVWVEE